MSLSIVVRVTGFVQAWARIVAFIFLLCSFLPLSGWAGSSPLVRIGLLIGVSDTEIQSEGVWALGILHSGLRPTTVLEGGSWRFSSRGEGVQVWDEAGRLRGAVSDTLFVTALDPATRPLRVDGNAYRGELLLFSDGDGLVVVNVVDLESYLAGVVPLEIGAQPPARVESIKAQAVAARSYTLAMLGRWARRGFDLMSTVEDQAYGGVGAEVEWCRQATEATRGVVAVDAETRRPITAFYSSTCGGHTATPAEVWGRAGASYLQGVRCKTKRVADSFCAISPRYNWAEVWEGAAFEEMLDRSLPGQVADWDRSRYGRLRAIEIAARGSSRRVSRLILEFERGSVELGGDPIRWSLRRPNGGLLLSAMLTEVAVDRRDGGLARVGIKGRGFGHGIGLCQFGAMGMSERGYDYQDILRFYYRGTGLSRFY